MYFSAAFARAFFANAHALLSKYPNPDDETVEEWLSSNICRCTGIEGIRDSVRSCHRGTTEMKVKSKSTGAVVFFVEGNKVFIAASGLHKRTSPKENQDSESPLEAARREVAEETANQLRFMMISQNPPYWSGKSRGFTIGGQRRKNYIPDSPEPDDQATRYRWLPYEEARALLNDRLNAELDWATKRCVPLPGFNFTCLHICHLVQLRRRSSQSHQGSLLLPIIGLRKIPSAI